MLTGGQTLGLFTGSSRVSRIYVGVFHSDAIVSAGVAAVLSALSDMDVQVLGRSESVLSLSDVIVIDARSAVDYMRAYSGGNYDPGERLLVIAQMGREWDLRAALAAGVRCYVSQNCAVEQLIAAVRSLGRGQPYMCTELNHVCDAAAISLTPRETQVLQLLALGYCNKSIARNLGIGVGTVKTYLKGVYSKLGATARTEAVAIASCHGLVDDMQKGMKMRAIPRRIC